MSVTSMEPTHGVKFGGTMITFTGENLGIGNRVVENVTFESRFSCLPVIGCENPTVQQNKSPDDLSM